MMEPKVGETYVFGEINPVKFPNKTFFTVKEVDTDDGGWVVLSSRELADWEMRFSKFHENFTKVVTLELKDQFIVCDNWVEAKTSVGKGWDNCWFDTWDEAVVYANKWLGDMGPFLPTEPGVPFSYGPGCSVTIQKCQITNFIVKKD